MNALIDTGCEINLIKTGFLPTKHFERCNSGIRLVTANGGLLGGGIRKTKQTLFIGVRHTTGEKATLKYLTAFYEADIACDAILSYRWLSYYHLDVYCRHNCLATLRQGVIYILPSVDSEEDDDFDLS